MSNIPTFSLSPLALSREAMHEVLVILCNFLLINRTLSLDLHPLCDVESLVFKGIIYVQSSRSKQLELSISEAMEAGSKMMTRNDESLTCCISICESSSKSSQSGSSGWLGGGGGGQRSCIEQWLLTVVIDPITRDQQEEVDKVGRCLFELMDLLQSNVDHIPSHATSPHIEIQLQAKSSSLFQSVLGVRPPPIF